MVAGIGEVVALVRHRHPHRRFRAVVEDDLLGGAQAEIILEEQAVRLDVDGEAIEVVEPAHVDAARGKALRLVLQRRLQLRRRLVPFGLVIELDDVAVGVAATERRPLPHVAVDPADIEAGTFQRRDAALQRLRAARAQAPCAPCLRSSTPSASANSARNRPSRADRPTRPCGRRRSCPSRRQRISGSRPASASAFRDGRDGRDRRSVLAVILASLQSFCVSPSNNSSTA